MRRGAQRTVPFDPGSDNGSPTVFDVEDVTPFGVPPPTQKALPAQDFLPAPLREVRDEVERHHDQTLIGMRPRRSRIRIERACECCGESPCYLDRFDEAPNDDDLEHDRDSGPEHDHPAQWEIDFAAEIAEDCAREAREQQERELAEAEAPNEPAPEPSEPLCA
jgi:hypothetical protein